VFTYIYLHVIHANDAVDMHFNKKQLTYLVRGCRLQATVTGVTVDWFVIP